MSLQLLDSTSACGGMAPWREEADAWFLSTTCTAETAVPGLLDNGAELLPVSLLPTSAGRTQVEEQVDTRGTSSAIMELRRLSGLTWEQLATLFHVARRSLHFWASGKPVNAHNEERLRRVLAAVRHADRGFAAKNRAMLFEDRDGVVPFDLLASEQYDEFMALVGSGPGRSDFSLVPLSSEVREVRKPQRPEELAGALQDRVHVEKGTLISSAPIRRKRQE